MGCYYDWQRGCMAIVVVDPDPLMFFLVMWLEDYWSDCWSGISWWPLAAIG